MKYLNIEAFQDANFENATFYLEINPFQYLDNRKPRLPRKSSKKYTLMLDTRFYFEWVFKKINSAATSNKFNVEIIVYSGTDKLGKADLDNYCKAILDGITSTKKVWFDDRQVDEINLKRKYIDKSESYITLSIKSLTIAD